jgi:hypothetical protein
MHPTVQILAPIHKKEISSQIIMDDNELKYFIEMGIQANKCIGYSKKMAWMRFLANLSGSEARKDFNKTKEQILEDSIALINEENNPVFRVKSLAYLKTNLLVGYRKVAYKDIETRCKWAVSGHFENKNAQKVTEKAKKLVYNLYINENGIKLLYPQIHRAYLDVIAGKRVFLDAESGEVFGKGDKELPAISEKTVYNLLEKDLVFKSWATKYRHGGKRYNDLYRPYVLGKKPQYALSMTSSDGETCPFYLKIKGKDTYNRATCYLIFDVMSGAIVGYAVGMQETKELMGDAFGNMLKFTNGIAPLENQLDNFNKNFETELSKIYPYISYCKPYSPQSKYAERLIGMFETQILRQYEGYRGANIQSVKDNSKVNPDAPTKTYTIQEIGEIYRKAVEIWNESQTTQQLSRKDLLFANINPECKQINEASIADMRGFYTLASIRRGYITIEVDGEEYVYEIPNYTNVLGKMQNANRVRVKYLPEKLQEKVWLYNYDASEPKRLNLDSYLCEAVIAPRANRAKAEQSEGDSQILGHHLKKVKEFDDWTEREHEKWFGNINELTINEIVINEGEEVLTDKYNKTFSIYQIDDEELGKAV